MKLFLFSLIALLSTHVFAAPTEVNWDTLKTLELDPKTKKLNIKPDLKKVLGKEILIKGFMMPLDYESKEVKEFLFMPYVPACMHVPPPPANQLILVQMKKGAKIKPSFYPIALTGKLAVEANADLESSYKFEGSSVKELKDYTPPPAQQGAHP